MKQKFTADEFKRLKYNVHSLSPRKRVLKVWQELEKVADGVFKSDFGFSTKADQDKVLRYICLVYDPNTPLLSITSMSEMKKYAASLAGFEDVDGKFDANVVAMISGRNKQVNQASIKFCFMHRQSEWALIVTLRERLEIDMGHLKDPDVAKEDKIKSSELASNAQMITELTSKFLNNDSSANLLEDVAEIITLGIRPEEVAQKVKDGERVVDEDYYE